MNTTFETARISTFGRDLGMKTMCVTGTMKAAMRRLASAAVGLAVGTALIGGVLVAASGSARAGTWTVSTTSKGSLDSTDTGPYSWGGADDPFWGNPDYPYDPNVMWGVGVPLHNKADSVQGSCEIVPYLILVWHHADDTNPSSDPAPKTAKVLVTIDSNTNWQELTAWPFPSLMSGTQIASSYPGDVSDAPIYPAERGSYKIGRQRKIIEVPAGQDYVAYPLAAFKAKLSTSMLDSYNWWQWGGMTASIDVTAAGTSQGVEITCSTNRRSPVAPPNDLDKLGNQRYEPLANGKGSGDVGVPFHGTSSVTYTAHRIGGWYVEWSHFGWFSSLKQDGDSDVIPEPADMSTPIRSFSVVYSDVPVYSTGAPYMGPPTNLAPSDIGKTDHVHLSYTDGKSNCTGSPWDQIRTPNPDYPGNVVTATDDFYMQVHPQIEPRSAVHNGVPDTDWLPAMVNFKQGNKGILPLVTITYPSTLSYEVDQKTLSTMEVTAKFLKLAKMVNVYGAVLDALVGVGKYWLGEHSPAPGVPTPDPWNSSQSEFNPSLETVASLPDNEKRGYYYCDPEADMKVQYVFHCLDYFGETGYLSTSLNFYSLLYAGDDNYEPDVRYYAYYHHNASDHRTLNVPTN